MEIIQRIASSVPTSHHLVEENGRTAKFVMVDILVKIFYSNFSNNPNFKLQLSLLTIIQKVCLEFLLLFFESFIGKQIN